ncbi:class I SAM-dependent methyltransferase [Amycolatopsis sp. FDAARGOS 1241]|uniref:class I SAM-dependent methyltransferase n=1 Tax=Amycolatopsis sp. FDAARGOS 1241 TaxID=2778070 RepID=UPI0019516ACC|nr:class I SAM-dependent methyltransferase [Amycolatopsis sp. FDAARGOS 1241]QRP46881.1 class I SAM-dependent methyltransferase [Amycolatopsis sp. FDAARGOS 1241]
MNTAALSGVGEAAFITLHARALDAAAPQPILADPHANRVVEAVDYDFARLGPTPKLDLKERLSAGIRGVIFDGWVQEFVDRHPDAVVLDLGCGLDSRAYRVRRPTGVDWYDVDLPAVIDLRRRLYPETGELAAGRWLDHLPADRPMVAVMDGLYPFRSPRSFPALLNRLSAHFDLGALLILGYSRLSSRMLPRVLPAVNTLGITLNDGFDDPHDVERWAPALRFVEQRRLIDSPDVAKMPPGYRFRSRLMARIPWLARMDKGVLRYEFGVAQ